MDRTSIDLTGKNFDPGNQAHVDTVLRKVEENHGPGWEIQDFADGVLTLVRRGLIHRVEGTGTTRTVSLGGIMRATDGEKAAQMLESDPKNAGWYLTGFQPHINRGILSKLTDAEVRCRSAVATALGVKPWDVQVSARKGGGFRLGLPPQYVPSKHDDKLAEVAEITVGELGWYFVGNSNALTGEIIPSTPPMFPASIPYPLDRMPHPQDGALRPIPIGERLADRGDEPNETLYLNFSAAPHAQLGGITGAGKLLPLDAKIPTPTGITTMGELSVGDEVLSRSGEPTRVIAVSATNPEPDLYEITLDDGQTIEADADHQWVVCSHTQRARKHQPKFLRAFARQAKLLRVATELRLRAAAADAHAEVTERELFESITDIEGLEWNYPASVRSALKFMDVPSRLVERSATVADSRDRITIHPVVYPERRALERLSERVEWIAGEARSLDPDERIMTTAEIIAETRVGGTRFAIRTSAGADLPNATLPVAPYTLGAWLGDGTARTGAITSMDEEVIASVLAEGYTVARTGHAHGRASTFHIDGLRAALGGLLPLAESNDGRKLDKRIPETYLRASLAQRMMLLRGIMDTDGTIDSRGRCGIDLTKGDLARDVLELIRSLGIKASMRTGAAQYMKAGVTHVTGTRYRISFTTTEAVFGLQRKSERLPRTTRQTQGWLYITAIRSVQSRPGRCIQVDSSDGTYLTAGFVPTHNSVTLNDIISGALAGGAELAIIDVPQKAVDFENWRPFVRNGGWGCESFEEGAVVLEELYREGERRASVLKRYKAKNVNELPADVRATMRDVVIIIDEVTGLFAPETVPRRLSGKDPLRVEAENRNYAKELIKTFVQKIAAEQRFVGFHLILSTQVASTDTGISTSLRTNLPHKMLLGAVATAGNRKLILANVSAAPEIPDRVKQDEDVAKGVGIAEFAGQPTVVFKSYYATEETLIEALRQRGIHPLPETQLDQTRPAHAAVHARFPDLAQQASDTREAATPQYGTGPRVYEPWELDPETGRPLQGFARANAARHQATETAKAG
ncbi:Hint domain-containing protein [Microbacterium xylanilyticum]